MGSEKLWEAPLTGPKARFVGKSERFRLVLDLTGLRVYQALTQPQRDEMFLALRVRTQLLGHVGQYLL